MSADKEIRKKHFLQTQMNRLGFGGAFNKIFEDSYSGRAQRIDQSDVITLQEFFDLNQSLAYTNDFFVCDKVRKGMYVSPTSIVYKRFVEFLINNGFTYKDWINLLPKTKRVQGGVTFDLSLLSKEQVLRCTIQSVTGINTDSSFYHDLIEVVKGVRSEDYFGISVTVKELLSMTYKEIQKIYDAEYSLRSYETTFELIQKKLQSFGFTKDDGIFMEIVFQVKTSESMIELLIQTKGFDREKAKLAVELGLEAGFISF